MIPRLRARHAPLELVEAGAHVLDESLGWSLAEDAADRALIGDGRSAALLGQQVDRERRVAGPGEPLRDRADVVGQAAVLVDDEDARRRSRPATRDGPGARHAARGT